MKARQGVPTAISVTGRARAGSLFVDIFSLSALLLCAAGSQSTVQVASRWGQCWLSTVRMKSFKKINKMCQQYSRSIYINQDN